MVGKTLAAAGAAIALLLMTVPATAQSYSDGYTFLKAVKERDVAKVTSLLAEPGSTAVNSRERGSGEAAIHLVTRDRDLPWLNLLLSRSARVDLQNQQGDTALSIAAQLGWTDGAERLLARKAQVDLGNARGETPLMQAVRRRDLAMVRLLLANGANPKKPDRVTGLSALDHARQDPRAAAILKLLEAPAQTPKSAVAGPKL